MDAIILAAGLGTRLRPHTLTTPKPLLPVRGRPILDWALGALPHTVDRVVVVVHYLAEQIEQYLRGQQHFADWLTVVQKEPRGTGDALRSCRPQLCSDHFLVLNGDDLYGAADLAVLADCPAGLLVQPVDEPRRFGIAFLRPDGRLDRLVEKPDLDGRRLANTGAYVFPREVFAIELKLSARGEYEITDYVSALATQRAVQVVEARFWLPIGTVEVWQQAQEIDLDAVLTRQQS
ncbi:MAG TPA: nucleotidyltransferase family protein [Gemmataceae bacterium]|jgi:bifunctional UDP-N-acetylglucosamine pyrophosphorylase/glucosamine-1-phosphate N-acetyltransferase|nr:nucleotidyltransferase family protein [Gemmataceae bacterium]